MTEVGKQTRPRVLLLSGDVARLIGKTTQTVRIMARTGELPPVAVTPKGVRLFDPEAVLRLRVEREREGR